MAEDPLQARDDATQTSLELEVEEQLVEHRASLAGLEEFVARDPDNEELLSVRDELVAAITMAEDSLLQLKHARLSRELDACSALGADVTDRMGPKPNATEDNSLQMKKSVFDAGSKCRFRHSNGRWYNGQVIWLENDGLARVSFLTPTTEKMQICRYYLQQRCRFGTNCRMSHGFVVSVDALKKFNPPFLQCTAIGSKVLACPSREGLGFWKQAELESWDEALQRGSVVFVQDGSHLEVGMEGLSLSEFADVSEDEGTSSEDDEGESEVDEAAVDDDGVSFATMSTAHKGPQTDTAIFANWEKHTRGMASKMMANMGYCEGMGLGRVGQGITTPLQVQVLPKNRSLDFINEGAEQGKGESNASGNGKSRGGKRKRDKKLAEAARAAKAEEERHPDVFGFINNQLAGYRDEHEDRSGKRVDRGGHPATTKSMAQKVDRRSLLAQEDEVNDLKSKVEKLEVMAHRNRRDKAVYDAVCYKLDLARKALVKAEVAHASSSHAVHNKEIEKKWLRF